MDLGNSNVSLRQSAQVGSGFQPAAGFEPALLRAVAGRRDKARRQPRMADPTCTTCEWQRAVQARREERATPARTVSVAAPLAAAMGRATETPAISAIVSKPIPSASLQKVRPPGSAP